MKHFAQPCLVLIAGLPGTGKSTVARAYVQCYGGIQINSDLQRNAMGLRGHYSPEDKEKVYQAMLEETRNALSAGQNVVVDSTFIRERVRAPFKTIARECHVPFYWVEMKAEETSIQERLKTPRPDSEADFSVFLTLRDQSEPIENPHLELWSDKMPLEDMLAAIQNYTEHASL